MMRTLALSLAIASLPVVGWADAIASVRYFDDGDQVAVSVVGQGTTADTPFVIASLGKTMTAVALLRYVQRGAIDLDDPVATFLPTSIADGLDGIASVTIRDLLAMTCGLADYYTDDYLDDALDDPETVQTPLVALRYAEDEPALFEAGADFDYSNTNYVIAGIILERLSGRSYAEVMETEVFAPAGMSASFVFGSAPLPRTFPNGHEDGSHVRSYYANTGFGDGGVISTAPDVVAFYRALFVEGRLLSQALQSEMLRDPLGSDYGLGVEIFDGLYGHSGGDLGFAADVRFDPRSGAVAVVLIADGDAETYWAEDRLLD